VPTTEFITQLPTSFITEIIIGKDMNERNMEDMLYAMLLAEVFKFDEVLADNMPITMQGAKIERNGEKVIPIIYDSTRADPVIDEKNLEKK